MNILIKATRTDDEGGVHWVSDAEADAFSVYLGHTGAYKWLTDFRTRKAAERYARQTGYQIEVQEEVTTN